MKRQEIINKLIKEGLSEKTLAKCSDRQINQLSERFFGESTVMISKKSPTFKTDLDAAKKQNKTIETYEQKSGKNPCWDGYEMVGTKKKNGKEVPNCVKKKKDKELKEDGWDSKSVAKNYKKINGSVKRNRPKGDNPFHMDDENTKDDFYKKLEKSKYDAKTKTLEPTESVKKNKKEVKEWVETAVENKYHPFTSKNEIMELIKVKLNEVSPVVQHGPKVKKGHNDIPEFMSYDSIKSSEMNSPKPSPATKPGPGIAPSPVRTPSKPSIKPKPENPFSPKPGERSKPKALK